MPRPTKLTKQMQETMVAQARKGAYREVIARANGISKQTLYDWLARGEEGGKRNAIYAAFLDALTRAEAEAELTLGNAAFDGALAGRENRGATEFLRRRYPERWSTTDRIAGKVEHEHGGKITHEHEEKVEGAIERFVEELAT